MIVLYKYGTFIIEAFMYYSMYCRFAGMFDISLCMIIAHLYEGLILYEVLILCRYINAACAALGSLSPYLYFVMFFPFFLFVLGRWLGLYFGRSSSRRSLAADSFTAAGTRTALLLTMMVPSLGGR